MLKIVLNKHDKIFLLALENVLDMLAAGKDLPDKNHNHPLIGEFKGCFKCYVKPDILLVYKIEKSELIILLLRIASHSNLF